MSIVNKTRIDRISFEDGSYAEFQRPTVLSERSKELVRDFLTLHLKATKFRLEAQLEQEALETLLLKQE